MTPLAVQLRRSGEACVLDVSGELALGPGLRQLRERAAEAFQLYRPPVIILDLTQTRIIDSSGLGEIVSVYGTALRHGARMALAGVGPRPRRLLEITRLDGILPCYPSVGAAATALLRS